MKKQHLLIVFLLIILVACQNNNGVGSPTNPPLAEGGETAITVAPLTATTQPPPTLTNPPSTDIAEPPPPTDTPIPTDTPLPPTLPPLPADDLAIDANRIFIYPVPVLYEGDQATFQVMAHVPDTLDANDVPVRIFVDDEKVAGGTLNGRNLGGDAIGLFAWVWPTVGQAGEHEVRVVLDPDDVIQEGDENADNNTAILSIGVQPASALPAGQANATWVTTETTYATIHVVSGTAAHRDIAELSTATDIAIQQAIDVLQEQPQERFDVYLVDRVFGQGGYAGSVMVVSYLDRDYSGGEFHQVLVHETVHLLDRQFAHNRIPFMAEGVAVWASGGHYKREDIDQRIIALRDNDLFIPLPDLVDDFYNIQHEIGYLEAGGFVNFLVNTYGWEAVRPFYADVVPTSGVATYADLLELRVQQYFGKSLDEITADWFAYLDAIPPDRAMNDDLLTTIRYYNTIRRYQLAYDPTAHFLQAWLPFPQELENRELTAEVTRRTNESINVTFEAMLQSVNTALLAGNYTYANGLLDSIERGLDNNGLFLDPLSNNYWNIVEKLSSIGFRVQSVELAGNEATVQVYNGTSTSLTLLNLVFRNQDWIVTN